MSFVFVSVGSTSFDSLISYVNSERIMRILKAHGFQRILFQIGEQGKYIPKQNPIIVVEHFRVIDNIQPLLKKAALVISHAGVGTVMETLYSNTPIIVVANHSLMDNHQLELAEKLASDNFIHHCNTDQELFDVLVNGIDNLTPYIECNTLPFKKLISEEVLFIKKQLPVKSEAVISD